MKRTETRAELIAMVEAAEAVIPEANRRIAELELQNARQAGIIAGLEIANRITASKGKRNY